MATGLVALSHRTGNSHKTQKNKTLSFSTTSKMGSCRVNNYSCQHPWNFAVHDNYQFMHTSVLFCTTTESTITSLCTHLFYFAQQQSLQSPVYAHICFILHNNRVYNHQFMQTSVLFCTTTESTITSLCTDLHVFHEQWWDYSWCRSIDCSQLELNTLYFQVQFWQQLCRM